MFWKSKMICTYFFLFKIFHAEHLSLYDKIAAVQLIPLTSVVLFWIKNVYHVLLKISVFLWDLIFKRIFTY